MRFFQTTYGHLKNDVLEQFFMVANIESAWQLANRSGGFAEAIRELEEGVRANEGKLYSHDGWAEDDASGFKNLEVRFSRSLGTVNHQNLLAGSQEIRLSVAERGGRETG